MSRKVAAVGAAAVLALAAPLIVKWEGARYVPYRDAVGVVTVCEGHTGPDIEWGRRYTREECAAFREKDMAQAQAVVRRCLTMPMLTHVEAALVSATYNIGPSVVCGSTLMRKAQANDWPGACAELDRWKYAGGRALDGLIFRRADERYLCETGKYLWLE